MKVRNHADSPSLPVRTGLRAGSGVIPPEQSGAGGGSVAGVFYPDRSGWCGKEQSTPGDILPPTQPSAPVNSGGLFGGGVVNGVFYADQSGLCA